MNINGEEIEDIIRGCKASDRKAQEKLYRGFYRAMMSLCVRYTTNEADSMEVLNSGFYKVYKSIGTYDPAKASLYTWIRKIIVNTCIDFIKKGSKDRSWRELDQAAEVDLPPAVFIKMSSAEILELIRQLPPATQAVFNLYVMEGYNHKEIATMMNISDGTSKWHLSEARRILKQLIKKEGI